MAEAIRRRRRVKIVATIGPASSAPDRLEELFRTGADVFRVNFSHGTQDGHAEVIDSIRRDKEQKLNHDHQDQLITAGWAQDAQEKAETLTQEFATWMQAHQDEFTALTIFYAEPFRRREITFAMLEQVMTALRADAPRLAPLRVYQAYQHLDETKAKTPLTDLTALVSLIRRACGVDVKLTAFDDVVRKNFQFWIMAKHNEPGPKFTDAQVNWLNMIPGYFASIPSDL